MKHYVSSCLWISIIVSMAFSADIYVSPTGSDAAAGTISAPFATVARARDKADTLKSGSSVTVWLRGGKYYMSEPVTFSAANSGTASNPIIYKAYPGEKPVLSGGIKVSPTWTTSSGSIMVATIPTNLIVDQLFLNGTRQILARYPNFTTSQKILDGYNSGAFAAARVALWANPGEGPGFIRALHSSQWGGNDYYMTGKSGTTLNYTWVGDNNRGNTPHSTYRMVENIFEELDAVGEWYYKKSTGQLFFWPPAGTDLNTATIELASLTGLLRFVGSGPATATSVQYIQFDGITFTHTYRTLFSAATKGASAAADTFEKITKSDWGMVRNGTVFMRNAENITIKNCLFDQVGGNGVFMSGYNRHNIVYNNDFEETGASCVGLFGMRSSIRCPNSWSTTPTCTDRTPGPLTNEYPGYCVIDNNMMNHLGRFEKQTSGVTLSATMGDTIRHNTIHDIPRAGINYCDGCFGGHLVEYNWVYRCVQETSDHGPFNAWGRDRNERFGSSDTTATKLDAWQTTTVRQNRFEAPVGMFGIDLDDQASNYYQYKNLLIGGGHKLQWNRNNTYLNNVIVMGADVQYHSVWSNCHHYGAHNIIFGTQTCLYQTQGGMTATSAKAAGVSWDSNDVYSTGGTPNISNWNACGTQVNTWAQWIAAGLDVHSVNANPLFVDTQKVWRANYLPRGNFNVQTGSPALGIGFQNFVMDSFGVMPVSSSSIRPSFSTVNQSFDNALTLSCSARRLTISFTGAYQVSILSISGRTLATYKGKETSSFALDPVRIWSGMYIAVVRTNYGVVSRRFIVIK